MVRLRRLLDIGINNLANMMHDMSKIAQECVTTAIDSYLNDQDVVNYVYSKSQQLVILKDEVNDLAIELIIRYQPLARDLRYISSCIEVAYDFVRFARYAYDIAQVKTQLGNIDSCDKEIIVRISNIVNEMLVKSIHAFNNKDVDTAEILVDMDDQIDSLYRMSLSSMMNSKDVDIRCIIANLLVIRYLERIADHTVYVGELVKYIVSGERTR